MHLRSLLKSTRLELLTSKKFSLGLYFLFGSSILFWWGGATHQFLTAYFELGEFDVSVTTFLSVTLVTFMIFVTFGAYMISIVVLRLRQAYWTKRMLVYANYKAWLNPASAGFVADYEYSNEETWATLFHLRNKNFIDISTSGSEIILNNRRDSAELRMYEKSILDSLIGVKSEVRIRDVNGMNITSSGTEAHKILAKAMRYKGFKDSRVYLNRQVAIAIKALFYFAGLIGVGLTYAYVFDNEIVTEIVYPRYPVHPVQIVADAAVWVVALLVILSGFWPRFVVTKNNDASMTLLQATGFKNYLLSVYKPKFKESKLHLLAQDDLAEIGPYMFAFKLVPLKKSYVIKYVDLVNTK